MSFIYNDVQCVSVHLKPHDEKECMLRVSVEVVNKGFGVKITDDNDPTVLYNLILSEEDYSALKCQQGLRVDFENFPKEFANLLAACKNGERQYRLLLGDVETNTPKSRPGCYLNLIERNTFNDKLCHLSLPLAPGSDSDIKQHLSKKINSLRNELSNEKIVITNLRAQNDEFSKELYEKNKRITELEVRLAEETSAIRLEQGHLLVAEKEKHAKERLELENEHQRNVHNLQGNIELLRHKNSVLLESKLDLESKLQVATMEKETTVKELNRVSTTNLELKMNSSTLERKLMTLEQHLAGVQKRLEGAENARQEKCAALQQAVWDLQASQEREKSMAAKLAECERRMQLHVNQMSQAKKELTHFDAQLTAKKNQVVQLLSVVGLLEKDIETIRAELNEKTKILTELEENREEAEELRKQLAALEKLTKEQEATIKRQIDVNSCLHRRLNEREEQNVSAPEMTSAMTRMNISNHTNRTLPPWLTSSAIDSDRSKLTETRKPLALDPSYLVPAEIEKPQVKQVTKIASAYFPK